MNRCIILTILSCLVLAPFAAHAVPITTGGPGGVGATDGTSKLIVWLQPDPDATEGTIINPWSDNSGSGHNFTYFDAGRTPRWTNSPINGQGLIAHYDGVDDALRDTFTATAADEVDDGSIFCVHDRANNSDTHYIFGYEGFNDYGLYMKSDDKWNWYISGGTGRLVDKNPGVGAADLTMIVGIHYLAGGDMDLWDQTGFLGSELSYTVPIASRRYMLGNDSRNDPPSSTGKPFDGVIAEFIAFETNLNTVQRYLVENYLCSRYDMTLTGRDFYAGDTAGNGDYDWDVCGVGRLSAGTEVDNGGMSGFGIEATSGLDDGDYVLAGHNLQFENTRVTTGVPAGMKRRWQRVFYLDKTGNVDVTLAFDHSESLLTEPVGGTDFALLYSATESPYSFAALAIAESVSGDTVSFAVADANLLDGYYTLASDEDIPAVSEVTGGTGPGGVGTTDGTSRLIVWLKPDNTATNGQIVGVLSPPAPWSDSSGYANHFDYFNAAERPEWTNNAINGQAAVAFSGTDTLRMPAGGQYTDTDAETVFVVHDRDDGDTSHDAVLGDQNVNNNVYALYKENDADGWQWLVNGGGAGASVRDAGRGVTIDGLQMIVGVLSVDLNSIALYDQGGLLKSSTFNTPSAARRYDLADTGSQALDGLIAEFVAFKTNLTTVQRYLVENYECSLYDMTLTSRDFYAGDTAGNGDYDLGVFGIGRLSSSDEVTSSGHDGLGIAAQWESLGDDEWALAGHKVPSNALVTVEGPDGRRWARVWYIDVTGIMDARLSFDFSDAGLAEEGSDYKLLYSAANAFAWSVVDADGSVDGDRMHFDVPAAEMVDGYYTVGFLSNGTLLVLR